MKPIHLTMAATLIVAGALLLACTDENIVNLPPEEVAQGISGRVVPPEHGAIISAWQASEIKRVTADDSGYFSLVGLPPGLYELRVETPTGAHRTISEVDVKLRETTALGTIQLAQLPTSQCHS